MAQFWLEHDPDDPRQHPPQPNLSQGGGDGDLRWITALVFLVAVVVIAAVVAVWLVPL